MQVAEPQLSHAAAHIASSFFHVLSHSPMHTWSTLQGCTQLLCLLSAMSEQFMALIAQLGGTGHVIPLLDDDDVEDEEDEDDEDDALLDELEDEAPPPPSLSV